MKNILIALLLPASLVAQTPIYRSVQPGVTAAIGTGTGTLTISGSTATFSVSQPDSVGVGDAIQYDSDGNSSIDAIAFIHGRTSGTEYTVKNAAGAEPTAVTGDEDWDIFRAYVSISHVEGGTENTGIDAAVRAFDGGTIDMVTATQTWHFACYRGTDATTIQWDTWNSNPTYYAEFFSPHNNDQVGTSQRHLYILSGSGTVFYHTGTVGTSFGLILDGLRIEKSAGAGNNFMCERSETNGVLWITNNVFIDQGHTTNTTNCLRITNGSSRTFYVWNNVLIALSNAGTSLNVGPNSGTGYVFNNTALSNFQCYVETSTGNGVRMMNNVAGDLGGAGVFNGWSGDWWGDSDYNTTSANADAPGANSLQDITFTSLTSTNWHFDAADAAIAIGTDLSGHANLPFSTDIDGDTRSTWNMGADEYIAVGGRKRKKPIWWSEYHEKDFIDWLLALR